LRKTWRFTPAVLPLHPAATVIGPLAPSVIVAAQGACQVRDDSQPAEPGSCP
jgi:hypothetical protein